MSKQDRKERFSLSMLFSVMVFVVLIVSVLVAAGLLWALIKFGVLAPFEVIEDNSGWMLLFMILISSIVGMILAFLTRNIPMQPFNRLINNMNRLAAGDFKVRLKFGKLLQGNPAFDELTESFNTMAAELENTAMLRSDFVNNFSHEFKTPIVSIVGFAKLLRRGNLTEEQKQEYLMIIEEESLRLSEMATNVLNMTRIDNQTILTDVSEFNLSEQLRSCVLLLEDRWNRKNLIPDLEFEEVTIQANEELLKQVWINLLDNAIKFSPAMGEIRLRIREDRSVLQISVTNYGSEIPPEKIGKIFDRFYQADESHGSKGNGVGLAIVKRVVELHKGKVSVSSKNDTTTFCVTLPKYQ